MSTGLAILALLATIGVVAHWFSRRADKRIVTEGLEALESLNREVFEKGGHRLEAVMQPDGNLKITRKQLWSDEQIAEHDREVGESVVDAIGRRIIGDQSSAAPEFLEFLRIVSDSNDGPELETERAVGLIWCACMEVVNTEPDSALALTFLNLNDAWQEQLPDD